jgi:branched-chain amino acid transport system ATP-binding protein
MRACAPSTWENVISPLLELKDIRAGYGETVVLDGVGLSLQEGQAISVLGRNGVGKTTLLSTVMGLTTLHAGSLAYQGKGVAKLPSHQRAVAGLGLVPQEREIFASLSVEENLKVAAAPGHWTLDAVYELFPRLRERRRNMGNQLSGGEQQMLAIGRALIGNPKVLLLDEPFEGLAPVIVDALVAAFNRLRQVSKLGIVLVEQHAELALELTEYAIVLDRGVISWQGASADLLRDPARLAQLIGLDAA